MDHFSTTAGARRKASEVIVVSLAITCRPQLEWELRSCMSRMPKWDLFANSRVCWIKSRTVLLNQTAREENRFLVKSCG